MVVGGRCGHCKQLAVAWERLAGHTKTTSALRAHAVVAKIDAEAERGIRDQFNVQSYPTILVFPPAKFGVSEPKVTAHPSVCCSGGVSGGVVSGAAAKQRPVGGQAGPGHSQQGACAPADPSAPREEHRVWGGLGASASCYVSPVLSRTCSCHFTLHVPAHIVSASPHSPHLLQAVSLVSEPIIRIVRIHSYPACTQRVCGA